MSETGWVIERYFNSELRYWDGRGNGAGTANWTRENADAIRFAREQDASVVLAHVCEGIGRVAGHSWGLEP